MEIEVLNARKEERRQERQELLQGPPAIPETLICHLQVEIRNEKHFIFSFGTHNCGYTLVVALSNPENLGWKEVQALSECMKLSCIGQKMDNASFQTLPFLLGLRFGSFHGPFIDSGKLAFVINPGASTFANETPDSIKAMKIRMNSSNDLVINSRSENNEFNVSLLLPDENGFLGRPDCLTFINLLTIFEPGDIVDRDKFLFYLGRLHVDPTFFYYNETSSGKFQITICGSQSLNPEPVSTEILDATERVSKQIYQQAGEQKKRDALPNCPYPDMNYVKLLGSGGFGKVYKAIKNSSETVVVKVLHGSSPEYNQVYKQELKTLLKMPDHKYIIEAIDFFEVPQPALVMQYIDGGDLDNFLAENGPLGESTAKKLALKIAEGIKHIHANGVVHLDLKPANIMLRSDEDSEDLDPVIIDLGNSSRTSATDTNSTDTPVGTLFWMAPEMIKDHQWSTKTDVYSFGIIFWQLLTGKDPFSRVLFKDADNIVEKLREGLRPDMEAAGDIEKETQDLIERCWEEDPTKRPSMLEVVDSLRGRDPSKIFEEFDKNGDGSLSKAEFMLFLEKYSPERIDEVIEIFNAVDVDKSGSICLSEFLSFWQTADRNGLKNAFEFAKLIRTTNSKKKTFSRVKKSSSLKRVLSLKFEFSFGRKSKD